MNVFDLYAKIGLDSTAYEKGLSGAKSLAETVGGGITGIFERAASLTADALSAAGSAVKAFAADAVKTGMDFDKSMSQVAATMGTTTDQIGELRDFAREMGSQTKYSATEAAEALNYMALAGYDAETSMAMLPNVLNLAAAGNFELARASDMVTDTQTAFGISIERTTQLVDEMAKASSTGNTSVSQLGEAFLTVGGLAQELNGGLITLDDGTQAAVDGVQELEIALTAMANAGIKGSEAGTHMRNILLKLASPTTDGIAAFRELGVEVFDDTGKMKSLNEIFSTLGKSLTNLNKQDLKLQYISTLFNSRDTAAVEALLSAMGDDWDNIGESILNAAGAAQQMSETQLDNLAGDIDILKSTFDELKISVSDILSPALRKFTKSGTAALGNFAKAVRSYGIKEGIEQWFDLESIIYTKKWERIWPEIKGLGTDFIQKFVDGATEARGKVMDIGFGIVDRLTEAILDPQSIDKVIETAPKIIQNFADGITEFLVGEDKDGSGGLVGAVGKIMNKITEYMKDDNNRAKLYESAKNILKTLGQFLVDNVKVLVPFVFELAGALASMVWEMLNDALMNLLNSDYHLGAVGQYGNAIKEAFNSADTNLTFEDWINAGMPGLDTDTYTGYQNEDSYYTMQGMTEDDGTGGNVPAAGWNEWQKYNENRQMARFEIAEPVRNTAFSSGENISISFGNINVTGDKNVGQEVVKQIDKALQEMQIQRQRGIGMVWQ